MTNWDELIDCERRTVSPRVFTDPDVYRAEQERVFGQCWLYVAHETQIPQPGDFVTSYMGEEPVIVCRDRAGMKAMVDECMSHYDLNGWTDSTWTDVPWSIDESE